MCSRELHWSSLELEPCSEFSWKNLDLEWSILELEPYFSGQTWILGADMNLGFLGHIRIAELYHIHIGDGLRQLDPGLGRLWCLLNVYPSVD